jgi:hypothetical protein
MSVMNFMFYMNRELLDQPRNPSWTCVREMLGSKHLTQTFCGFPQSLQPNAGIVSGVGHDCLAFDAIYAASSSHNDADLYVIIRQSLDSMEPG